MIRQSLRATASVVFQLATVIGCFLPRTVEGQSVQGRVTDGVSQRPIIGAEVKLLTEKGKGAASAVSDSAGFYLVTAPDGRPYVIKVDAMGYRALVSPLMLLEEGKTLKADFELPPDPIELEGMTVEARALDWIRDDLKRFGVHAEELGERLVGPVALAKRAHATDYASVLQWQSIPGMSVVRTDDLPVSKRPPQPYACVKLVPGRATCALAVLDGTPTSLEGVYAMPPEGLGAIVVLTPNEATLLYGTGAAGGAVLLFTKGYLATRR